MVQIVDYEAGWWLTVGWSDDDWIPSNEPVDTIYCSLITATHDRRTNTMMTTQQNIHDKF